MYVCRETGVCLERLECFGRRVACAYVYEEREMCVIVYIDAGAKWGVRD